MQNSNQTNLKFPILSADRYGAVEEKARQRVRERIRKPEFSMFAEGSISSRPKWLIYSIMTLLFIVMAGAFVFSAGKQVAVISMLIDELPGQYQRLSTTWATLAVGSTLLVSEFGSVLFMVSAGVFGGEKVNFWRFAVSPYAMLFGVFAIACASLALICNVAVAAIDTPASVSAVSWFTSVLIPSIVLGIGVILERIILGDIERRDAQRINYGVALKQYQLAIADPTSDPDYGLVLTPLVFEEIMRLKRDRDIVIAAMESHGFSIDDPRVVAQIVKIEVRHHKVLNALEVVDDLFVVSDVPKRPETLIDAPQTGRLPAGVSETKETLPPAVQKAVQWLKEHPETASQPVRAVAAQAGMSTASIQRAREVLK